MNFLRFSHPQYLLLLPLVWAYTWWVLRGSLADLRGLRGRVAVALRLLLVTLLLVALAGIQFVRPTTSLCTVFVVDVSDSIAPSQSAQVLSYIQRAAAKMQPRKGDSAAVVAFGAEALLDHAPDDVSTLTRIVSLPGTTRTDIAAGIQLAMASFPQESGKQIVLFTDGNENLGNLLDQAGLAQSNEVRVNVVPLERDTTRGEALLLRVDVPTDARQGAPFQVSVLAETTRDVDGTLTLFRDDRPIETRAVSLKAGKTSIAFEDAAPSSGTFSYKAMLNVDAAQDAVPDNNVAYAYTRVKGKPTALVVEGQPGDGQAVAEALRSRDIDVEYGGPDRIPTSLAACSRYDSILFANVAAWQMSPAQMSIIRSAVHDTGMGFAMVGGEFGFGAGGYYGTPVEAALPVTMDVKKQKVLPSVAVVIVIDISGSMGEPEAGVPKIRLAGEATKAAANLLQPIDQICVIGYDAPGAFTYVVPMSSARNKARINRQIDTLAPGGGGIYGYPALQEAYRAIRGTKAQLKHIIMCMDAADDDEHGDAVNFARNLRRMGITTTVVGFGNTTDKDWPHFQQVSKAGGSQAILTQRLGNLPQIFTRIVLTTTRSLIVEKPFRPNVLDTSHPAMRGIPWEETPALLGYVATTPQASPLTRVLLTSSEDDPILATWSYGLGRSLAFTSDATAHWAAPWLSWPSYAPFWSQSLRWTLRQGTKADFQTLVTEEGGRATITVDAVTPTGEFRNMLDLRAHIAHVDPVTPDGPQETREVVTLEQTAPGHYESHFDARGTGAYMVTVEERDGEKTKAMQMATMVIPYSPEYRTVDPNVPLLRQVAERTRGHVDPPAEDIFGKLRVGSRQLRNLWPLLLTLLAVLFLADVAVRRVLLPWDEFLAMVRDGVASHLPRWRRTAPATPVHDATLGTLLTTKEQIREPRAATGTTGTLRDLLRQPTPPTHPTPAPMPEPEPTPAPPPQAAPAPPPAATEPTGTVSSLLKKKRERGEK